MMKLSLVQVYNEENGTIDGVWLQDFTGSLSEAIVKASKTEKANSNRIKVAIVERISGSAPDYSLLKKLKRIA